MDYSRPPLADRLASEYVLGTLRGGARRRFEALLPAHPQLQDAVARWQRRLVPLAATVTPVQPSPRVWQRIEQQLFGAVSVAAQAPLRWWQRLGLWQGATGLAGAAAIALAVLIAQPQPTQPPIVVVLGTNPEAASVMQASFVASVSADGKALVLRPVGGVNVDATRALELWAVPAQGAPRSLGLVAAQGATTVVRAELLRNTAAFAVSLEPAGGSKTGAPTGPILSLGKLEI
ncbi:anti-sigma factor domain-containing protein [Piscinibacterium candidicorallinum]|uniref:Anti-sigma factor domain-containing protein n=1 Tax=Piscinibacterium candidicorallinum TaxID=1793872 RepID=A0ABV7GX21_9BURK